MKFQGTFRHYQELALAAYATDKKRGNRHTNIVAPPGSGKTIIGLEMIARAGGNALILCPNTAIQQQWIDRASMFGAQDIVGTCFASDIVSLTYQALCQFEDPEAALKNLAQTKWARDRSEKVGETAQATLQEALTWTGDAAKRRDKEMARITASLRRQIARGDMEGFSTKDMLSQSAQERLEELQAHQPKMIVLDECHHLFSLWGYVVKMLVDTFPDCHIVGLTATPPDTLTTEQARLYHSLLGDVDFMVPTPAIVKDGHLAPYQELAYFVEPLADELKYLNEHEQRFNSLIQSLYDDALDEEMSFPAWLLERMKFKNRRERAQITWSTFQKHNPELARAACRYFNAIGVALPKDAPKRAEGYTEDPQVEDWIILLEDYALGCLVQSNDQSAQKRYQSISVALKDLGYLLTRRGIKRAQSETDRMLAYSRAKHAAVAKIVELEESVRQDHLRAVVLCDTERPRKVSESLGELLDATSSTCEGVLVDSQLWAGGLRPLIASGRGLRCNAQDAEVLLVALESVSGIKLDIEPLGDTVRFVSQDKMWMSRTWVQAATQVFTQGTTKLLIGTRAMLAEGWDCPRANVLVDLTMATTATSVRQMRGRTLRVDQMLQDKLASNWDVVCIASQLAAGRSDYRRFVKKHSHLYAPSEDGSIEAGPGHVYPGLSSFEAPASEDFERINKSMFERARGQKKARTLWQIGTPYKAENLRTLVIRNRKKADIKPPKIGKFVRTEPPTYDLGTPGYTYGAGGSIVASLVPAVVVSPWIALAGAVVAGAVSAFGVRHNLKAQDGYSEILPLDLAARSILATYVELGEITQAAADTLMMAPRADGYLRCYLLEGSVKENERFTRALEDLLDPVLQPRYIVSREVMVESEGFEKVKDAFSGQYDFKTLWYIMPDDFARNKKRAAAFYRNWQTWMGVSQMHYSRDPKSQEAMAEALAQGQYWESRSRSVWR